VRAVYASEVETSCESGPETQLPDLQQFAESAERRG